MIGGTPHAAGHPAARTGRETPTGGFRTSQALLALLVAAAAIALGALLALWPLLQAAGDGGAPAWLYMLACLLWLAGAGAIGAFAAMRHGQRALQEARAELAALRQSVDAWQWRTDAAHRIEWLRPPPGDSAPPLLPAAGQALWERFEAAPPPAGGLRALLDAQGPLDGRFVAPDGTRWQLRGAPRLDRDGRFAGHAGTARPLDTLLRAEAGRAACDAMAGLLPGPAWLLLPGDGDAAAARAVACNAAAEALAGGADTAGDALMARLPRGLAQAVRALAPGGSVVHDGWHAALADVAEPPGTRLLLLLPRTTGDGEAGADDHDAASFSYTVSHDLRAPVRVVEGFARILKEDYGRLLDRIGNDHLDRVLGAAARMNAMIDALLNLAQLSSQPLSRQPVNLSQLAGYVVDDLRRQQPQRRADVRIAPGLLATGDPTLLRLVLENLLGNAWKYSSRCDKAEIVFERAEHDGREAFVVRDNGAGFDMRFADRLFGVFQRLHSANDFPGTGIGLASVRRIVHRHGGEVWADSSPGQGARFWFTLRG